MPTSLTGAISHRALAQYRHKESQVMSDGMVTVIILVVVVFAVIRFNRGLGWG